MAEKRNEDTTTEMVAAATHNEASRAISDIKVEGKGYSESKWSGVPIFVCDGCGADSFTERLVADHVNRYHR